MAELSFLHEAPLFCGDCVHFVGTDGEENIAYGVTAYALKYCDPSLPHHGLLPAEAFIAAFEKLIVDIHNVAKTRYENEKFETDGPIRVMGHREDIAP